MSTLSNGATLVTEDAASATTVAITYPGAGSSNEAVGETGAALANKCMAFKSGSGLSSVLIYRSLEDEGATPFSAADRFGATVGFTVVPEKATLLAPLLATDCSFERWDVRDAKKTAETLVKEAEASAPVCFQSPSFCALFDCTEQFRPLYLPVSPQTHCLILHHTEIVYPLYRFLSLPAPCPFPYPS